MNKLIFTISLFYMNVVLACPMCAGSNQSGRDRNTTAILISFIILAYIPYLVIFRLIKKFKNFDHNQA